MGAPHDHKLSFAHRLRQLLPRGVLLWLPAAVISAIWMHASRFGFSFASFTRREFALRLAINIVVIGLIGGLLFDRFTRQKHSTRDRSEYDDRNPRG